MAHVITLQLSSNRLPRWLSEGISVFEERRARPDWGREMDIPFARAIDRGAGDQAARPELGLQQLRRRSRFAYYQASLVVEHIVDTYGQPKLRALVQSYADGIDTEAAIKQALGVDIDELQKSFDAFLDKRFATLRRALKAPEGLKAGHAARQAQGARRRQSRQLRGADGARRSAARESNPDAAIAAFEKAAQLIPNVPGEDSPHAAIAALALKKGDKARAAEALETLTGYSHTDVDSARELATLLDADEGAGAHARSR